MLLSGGFEKFHENRARRPSGVPLSADVQRQCGSGLGRLFNDINVNVWNPTCGDRVSVPVPTFTEA
jgi:hypothetical protein